MGMKPLFKDEFILGIHSNVAGTLSFIGSGHAWLTITTNGITKAYGLWPDGVTDNGKVMTVNNGAGFDIRTDVELKFKYKMAASRFYKLNTAQAKQFNNLMKVNVTWANSHNCSSFASDTVWAILKEDVDADEWFGIESPRELGESILELERNDSTNHLKPKSLKNIPKPTAHSSKGTKVDSGKKYKNNTKAVTGDVKKAKLGTFAYGSSGSSNK